MDRHVDGENRHWQPGDQVLLRYRRNLPADVIAPVTVVADTASQVALYTPAGSPLKVRVMPDGTPMGRATPFAVRERMPVVLGDAEWHSANVLWLSEPGRASSIGLFWSADDWRFLGYYGNLQAPLRRMRKGFDTADYLLDVAMEPDLTWRWKDEDEFETAQHLGIFTAEQATAIRAEGERIIADVEARRPPFDGRYDEWCPELSWTVPTMPTDWDRE